MEAGNEALVAAAGGGGDDAKMEAKRIQMMVREKPLPQTPPRITHECPPPPDEASQENHRVSRGVRSATHWRGALGTRSLGLVWESPPVDLPLPPLSSPARRAPPSGTAAERTDAPLFPPPPSAPPVRRVVCVPHARLMVHGSDAPPPSCPDG